MTVYADVLVIVNLYIDFFLLWCVRKFLGLKLRGWRLVPGALTGGFLSLTALLPGLAPWLSLALGLLTALAVSAAAFAPLPPAAFFKAVLCFWAFSLLLAGFFLFLLRFFAPRNIAVLGNVVYFDLSPLLLFLFTCGAYLVISLFQRLLPSHAQDLRCRWLTVENRGQRVRLYAKADTGNSLREPFSGLPVLVCQAESLKEAAPPGLLEFSDGTGASFPVPGIRLIPFESVGGAGVLPAFRPEKVTDDKTGTVLECYVALSRQKLSAGQFDALYDPDQFFGNGKF